MFVGFALAAAVPFVVLGFAKLTLRLHDWGCGVLAGYIGVAAGVAVGVAHIRFLSPFVHGLLTVAAVLVAGGIATVLALGSRFAAALTSGDTCLIDDWFPSSSIELDSEAR